MAQMSFGLSGGFWPTSYPLFQASRLLTVSISYSLVIDRSLIVLLVREWQVWGRILYAYYRPFAAGGTLREAAIQMTAPL